MEIQLFGVLGSASLFLLQFLLFLNLLQFKGSLILVALTQQLKIPLPLYRSCIFLFPQSQGFLGHVFRPISHLVLNIIKFDVQLIQPLELLVDPISFGLVARVADEHTAATEDAIAASSVLLLVQDFIIILDVCIC